MAQILDFGGFKSTNERYESTKVIPTFWKNHMSGKIRFLSYGPKTKGL